MTRLVVRSKKNAPGVAPDSKFVALLVKTTNLPSAEIASKNGITEAPFACSPELPTEILSVAPLTRSRTKMSDTPFVSDGTTAKTGSCP